MAWHLLGYQAGFWWKREGAGVPRVCGYVPKMNIMYLKAIL